jgi:hypothetical protein
MVEAVNNLTQIVLFLISVPMNVKTPPINYYTVSLSAKQLSNS